MTKVSAPKQIGLTRWTENFIEIKKQPALHHEETQIISSPIINKEVGSIIKNFPTSRCSS